MRLRDRLDCEGFTPPLRDRFDQAHFAFRQAIPRTS
jgi:hypothetical protein